MVAVILGAFLFTAGLQVAAMDRVGDLERDLRQREEGVNRVNELIDKVGRLGRCQYEQVAEHRVASREHFEDMGEVHRKPFRTDVPLTPHTGDLSPCDEFGPKAVVVPPPGG